jgi:hypothetical protein
MHPGKFGSEMPDVLQEARKYLLPGLSTTDDSVGMDVPACECLHYGFFCSSRLTR